MLLRLALNLALTRLVAPRLGRTFTRLSTRVPANSFAQEVLGTLGKDYSKTLVQSLGRTAGDLVLGGGKKRRR